MRSQVAIILLSALCLLGDCTANGQSVQRQSRAGRSLLHSPLDELCIGSPTNTTCTTYIYAPFHNGQDVANLCNSNPDMPGCSLFKACQAGLVTSTQYCGNFTILATICNDNSALPDCATYNSLCKTPGSVIQQCTTQGPIQGMPDYSDVTSDIASICTSMPGMAQCSQCTQASCPDPLATISGLCLDMPSMGECDVCNAWCAANGAGLPYYCSKSSVLGSETGNGSSNGGMDMAGMDHSMSMHPMAFHEGLQEVILWAGWATKTRGEYVGTIFAVLTFGFVSMAIKTVNSVLTIQWKHDASKLPPLSNEECWLWTRGSQSTHNAVKAVLIAASICLDFFNMLVAMTFNAGLFVAVIMGYALGTLLLSHIPENYAAELKRQTDCKCLSRVVDMEAGNSKAKETAFSTSGSSSQSSEVQQVMPACCPGHV